MTAESVRQTFIDFQKGYQDRDVSKIDSFMKTLFVQSEDVEIIGTNAVKPGQGEWCRGLSAAKDLISSDWQYWGDVKFEIDQASIHVLGDVAWLATYGMVNDTIPIQERYKNYNDYIESIIDDESMDQQEKFHEIVQLGNDVTAGIFKGEQCVWPFRFSAVLVKQKDKWLFHQLNFSFATTRSPQVWW